MLLTASRSSLPASAHRWHGRRAIRPWTSLWVISNGIISRVAGNLLVAAPHPGVLLWRPQTDFYSQGDWVPVYPSGGPSLNPGKRDLTTLATNSITLGATDIESLRLGAGSRPVLGTNWNLITNQVPATGVLGVDIFGLADPGVLDLFFLGMPGCQLRTTLDFMSAWVVAGSTHNYSFAVPAAPPSLIGFQLFTQSAVFQVPPVNAFGAITSNGIKGTLGDV